MLFVKTIGIVVAGGRGWAGVAVAICENAIFAVKIATAKNDFRIINSVSLKSN
jgi:hypothetical protein